MERSSVHINLDMNANSPASDENPALLRGNISGAKGWPHKRNSTVYKICQSGAQRANINFLSTQNQHKDTVKVFTLDKLCVGVHCKY